MPARCPTHSGVNSRRSWNACMPPTTARPTGLDQLRIASVAATFPPAGFDIESASAAALRKQDEELNRTNPQLASWIRIRRRLEAPDGEAYFAASLHNTPLPMRLKGTLLRTTPAGKPKELVLGVGDATAEEVILKLETAFPNDAEPAPCWNLRVRSTRSPRRRSRSRLLADPEKIEGWPARRPRK